MFENLNFEINSTYIVIGLIIVALVCIYLLYSTLTSGSYYNDLKANINELIVQNKKRDEIIHFLVNQVQMQQSELPVKEVGNVEQHVSETENEEELHQQHINFQNFNVEQEHNVEQKLSEEQEDNIELELNDDDIRKLDELLENDFPSSRNNIKTEQETTNTELDNLLSEEDLQEVEKVEEVVEEGNVNKTSNLVEEEEVENDEESDEGSSDEIIANILGGSIDSKDLPKDKVRLSIFTVNDLREHAKNLNISSSGNKSSLINRIYDAL